MGRIIAVASGKGGVGKTTFVSNLVASLNRLGKSTIAVDANLTTPNLGLHLGIPLYPVTLQDVLAGEARLKEAVYRHKLGFSIMPADISLRRLTKVSSTEMTNILYRLADAFEFVIVDSAAGLGREALVSIDAADEMITVTNPEMPALVEALKLGKIAEKTQTKHLGVVLNKVRKDKHEVPLKEVKEFLNMNILGEIPDDINVKKALHKKEPVVISHPNSLAAKRIAAIAAGLVGEKVKQPKATRMFNFLR